MTTPSADESHKEEAREYTHEEARQGWLQRRGAKVRAELERNRRGEYTVPTWALAALLVAIVVGWAALIAFS